MTNTRRTSRIGLPADATAAGAETFPAGKVPARPATAVGTTAETGTPPREPPGIAAQTRAANDALAQEHLRLKRLGLVIVSVPLDEIRMTKLVRDRNKGPDFELAELKASIADLGLSNPVRLEATAHGGYELIQGYRRLSAYRALRDETGDHDRYGAIPAAVTQTGDDLDALYRRMVDENLVRKDISFAEMAMLALDYARDPGTSVDDPERAVAVLFRSAGYQKRSYIRTFMTVVERLGRNLRFPQDIPRSLGLALAQRLDEVEGLARQVQAALQDWDNRSVADKLAVLRRFAGAGSETGAETGAGTGVGAPPVRPARPKPGGAARAQSSFPFDRHQGRGTCVAGVGRLEIRLDRDFTTVDRRRLEQAVRLMLDQIDG